MPVHVGLATIIIPRNCIDSVFPGGFEKYRLLNEERWSRGHPIIDEFIWYDDYIVVVDDSMGGAHHIDPIIEYWRELGLDPERHIGYAGADGSHSTWLEWIDGVSMVKAIEKIPQFE